MPEELPSVFSLERVLCLSIMTGLRNESAAMSAGQGHNGEGFVL